MHYRRLGRSGLKVSEISFGTWITFGSQIDQKTSDSLIKGAFENGVNYFDCADVYANGEAEIALGKAIKGIRREELVLSSKCFWPTMPGPNGRGLSRKHIIESVNTSLKRMDVEYLDLYFCHRYDPDTPTDEIVRTMDILMKQGKILYWGTSEWNAAQIMKAISISRQYGFPMPTMEQPQYNMFKRKRVENELSPICKEFGVGLTTWSPLFSGILSGKYNNEIPDGSRASLESMAWVRDELTPERLSIVRDLTALAQEFGYTTAQLAIAWLLRRKEVSSVITGATHIEQFDENVAASEAVKVLTDDVLEQIESILERDQRDCEEE